MAKTWVLDTETKGTGAEVVPLEKARKRRAPEPALNLVKFRRPPRVEPPADVRPARRFKVVDLMTRQTLAEHASTRETLELLSRTRSSVDVHIYVWQSEARKWRLLTLDEQRALWDLRGQAIFRAAP